MSDEYDPEHRWTSDGNMVYWERRAKAAERERDEALADITISWKERDAQKFAALQGRIEELEAACVYVAALSDQWARTCKEEGDDRVAGAWLDAREGARQPLVASAQETD